MTDRLTASPPRPVPKVSRCESVRRVPRNSLATWTRILPSQGWILSIWIAVGKFDRSLRSIGKRVTELRRRSRSHRAKDPIERYLPSGRPRCTCSPVDPALVTQTCHLGHPRLGAPLLRTSPGCSSGRSPPRCSYLGPDRPKSRRSCRCNSDVSPRSPDTRCPVAPLRPVSRSRSWLAPVLRPRGLSVGESLRREHRYTRRGTWYFRRGKRPPPTGLPVTWLARPDTRCTVAPNISRCFARRFLGHVPTTDPLLGAPLLRSSPVAPSGRAVTFLPRTRPILGSPLLRPVSRSRFWLGPLPPCGLSLDPYAVNTDTLDVSPRYL